MTALGVNIYYVFRTLTFTNGRQIRRLSCFTVSNHLCWRNSKNKATCDLKDSRCKMDEINLSERADMGVTAS